MSNSAPQKRVLVTQVLISKLTELLTVMDFHVLLDHETPASAGTTSRLFEPLPSSPANML